jgi:hypothetical protein
VVPIGLVYSIYDSTEEEVRADDNDMDGNKLEDIYTSRKQEEEDEMKMKTKVNKSRK